MAHALEPFVLSELLQYLPAVFYTEEIGPSGEANCSYCSPHIEHLLGYSCQEWQANPQLRQERLHPDDRQRVVNEVSRWRQQGCGGRIEFRYLARDGRVVWVREEAWHLRLAGRAFLAGVVYDITEAMQAQQTLHQIISAPGEMIYVADPETYEVLYLNEAGRRIFPDAVGRRCYEALQGLNEPCPFCTNGLILREQGKTHVWLVQNERNGRWYRHYDRAIPWTDGRLVRFTMAVDVTDLKSEQERSLKLERQLAQAAQLEAMGRLSAGIAHDFNNLLTGIAGYAELALDSLPENAPMRADLAEISHIVEKAHGLTRQLLAFSRQQELKKAVVSLNDMVRDTAKMLRRLIGEDIELVLELGQELPELHADPTQIMQVVLNLAVNARDAMPNGGTLTVRTAGVLLDEQHAAEHPEMAPGRYAHLQVSDSGAGMSEEVRQHIFEPFFSTKGPQKGTGLGLAVVYGIVRQHDGYIHVSSELGKGTSFDVYFPAAEKGATVAQQEKEEKTAPGTETLLLVEDEAAVRQVVSRGLRQYGYHVLEAASPSEALKLVQEGQVFDLLVSDVVMPGLSGPQLYELLRQERPGLKVLFVSGYTGRQLPEGAPYLEKPFSGTALARKVREVLDRSE